MASFALGLETHQVSATVMMSPQGFIGSPYLPKKDIQYCVRCKCRVRTLRQFLIQEYVQERAFNFLVTLDKELMD